MPSKTEITRYRGVVVDRMSGRRRKTRFYNTWEAGHHAAEKLLKRIRLYYNDRYEIKVETVP